MASSSLTHLLPWGCEATRAGQYFPENSLKAQICSDPGILLLGIHPTGIWTCVCKAWYKNIYECCLLTITQAVTLSSHEQGTEKINHAVSVKRNKDIERVSEPWTLSQISLPLAWPKMVHKLRAVLTFLNGWGKNLRRAFCDS